jgi:thiamine pyrophosphate-dependent acetolactate synthase large subunit-like protein
LIFHSTCNKPILLVGNGARTSGAHDKILEFSRKTNIPILTTMVGVDLVQSTDHIGFIGTHGNRVANMILNVCDLIISVGARLSIRQVGRDSINFAPNAKLIRVDIDENELSRNIKDDEKKYHMDAKDFMVQLLSEDIPDYNEWKLKCLEAKCLLDNYDQLEGNKVVEKISDLLPENPIVAIDVGQNQCWSAQSLLLKGNKGRILISGGYGTMGCGLPYAIGAAVSNKGSNVYCIAGDGGFQMNIQELEVLKRDSLPIKIFILNNQVLGKISETQYNNLNKRYAQTTVTSGYTVPDFHKIANAYGIKAATINSFEELDNYSEWICDKEPCLFNINLSNESFLIPKIKFETGLIEPRLPDDVFESAANILRN